MNPMDFIESLDPQILLGASVAVIVIVAAAFLFSSKKAKGFTSQLVFILFFYVTLFMKCLTLGYGYRLLFWV